MYVKFLTRTLFQVDSKKKKKRYGRIIPQISDLLGLEFRKSSSLIFLFPTDFTDTHRLLIYGVQADLQSAFKKCPDLFGICGFAIRSKQECCCWIRAHSPRLSLKKRRNLYIFGFLGSRGRSWYGFSENGREKRKKQNLPPKSQNLPVALQQSYTLNIGSRHMNREKMHLIPNNFCIFAVRIRYLFICQ